MSMYIGQRKGLNSIVQLWIMVKIHDYEYKSTNGSNETKTLYSNACAPLCAQPYFAQAKIPFGNQ